MPRPTTGKARRERRHLAQEPLAEEAGLKGLRLHDLRHPAGTFAARTGATTKELMTRLGHASANAALIYQHASAERDKSIADGLTAMYRDTESGTPSAAKNRQVKGRPKA